MRHLAVRGAIVAVFGAGLIFSAPSVRADTEHTVRIRNFLFHANTLTISVGDTVTWRNLDSVHHTATGSSFDSGRLARGESYSVTFTEPGTYSYQCTPHPHMRGRIVVEADAAQSSDQPIPNTSMAPPHGVAVLAIGFALMAVAALMAVRRRVPSDH